MAALSFVNGHPKRALAAFLELPCHVGTHQDAGEEHRLARLIRYEDKNSVHVGLEDLVFGGCEDEVGDKGVEDGLDLDDGEAHADAGLREEAER